MPARLRNLFNSLSESLSGRTSHNMTSMEDLGLAFHEAAIRGNKRRVRKILRTGLLIDYPNDNGQTALFCACFEGQAKIVNFLLKNGANPNIKCREGSTPLHAGAYSGDIQIVSQLVAYGGDLRLHDNKLRSVSDWASHQGDQKKKARMLEFLSRIRNLAMSRSGRDLVSEKQSREFFENLKAEESHSLIHLFRRTKSSTQEIDPKSTVQNLGYGKVYRRQGNETGAVATIPLVPEIQLQHDDQGLTYNNGPFMVNESMTWDKTLVTAKRLHKDPLDGGVVDQLINEYEYMSRLRHPNIMLLMGVCNTNNMDGLVLLYERIGLGSLYHHMHHLSHQVTPGQMLVMMQQLCDGVLYLHQHNLIHCYITSHAVHLASPTVTKLGNMEYMIHNVSHEGSAPRSEVTNNCYINAAYNWMSPELMAGEQPSELSDVYSLCSVMWEIIHGAVPWGGLHVEDIMSDLLELGRCLPLDVSHLGRTLYTVLATGLNPDLTVRSTLSVGRIRIILTHLHKDREKRMKLGTSISLLNRHWGSASNSLNGSPFKDEDKDASLSTRRYSGTSTYKDNTSLRASGGSLADTSQSASPCRQPSPKKRIAPSPSPDDSNISQNNQTSNVVSSAPVTKDIKPVAAPRKRSLSKTETSVSSKAFTKWTLQDDLEIREIVAKVQQSPISKTPVKIISAPRLGPQPYQPACRRRPVTSIPFLPNQILPEVATYESDEDNISTQAQPKRIDENTSKTGRGGCVFEVLSKPTIEIPVKKSQVSERVTSAKKLLQAAGIDREQNHSPSRLEHLDDSESEEDEAGIFKPASHRQSMEMNESPSGTRRRRSGSLLLTDIPSQTGSIHKLFPPSIQPRHAQHTSTSPGSLQTASLPRSFLSPAKARPRISTDLSWDQYRSERYHQLMSEGKPTAMTAAERSPERISPRDMKTDWFEGSGSIKNLISEFQSQWIKHEEHQAILCLKSKKDQTELPVKKGTHIMSQEKIVKVSEVKMDAQGMKNKETGVDEEECGSVNSNNNAADEASQSMDSSIGRGSKRYDVEEFYFDDEINPNVPQERHLRLEATVNLSRSVSSCESRNVTPNNTPAHVTPSDSEASIRGIHYVTSSSSSDSILDQSPQDTDRELSCGAKVLPPRRESLHIIQICDTPEEAKRREPCLKEERLSELDEEEQEGEKVEKIEEDEKQHKKDGKMMDEGKGDRQQEDQEVDEELDVGEGEEDEGNDALDSEEQLEELNEGTVVDMTKGQS